MSLRPHMPGRARPHLSSSTTDSSAAVSLPSVSRTGTVTGQVEQVMIPCSGTLASVCPSCAERARTLRATQCREGWHLEDEPDPGLTAPGQMQEYWLTLRAEAQVQRDHAEGRVEDVAFMDCSGLSALVSAGGQARRAGGDLVLAARSSR